MTASLQLDRPPARSRLHAPLVLVAGGKGGVGKTTLATNLALELCRRRERVLLVDLDLGLSNAGVFMGLTPSRDVGDALDGTLPFENCIVQGPLGLDLLPAACGREDLARGDPALRGKLLDGLEQLSPAYDLLIADCPAGIHPDVMAYAAGADLVLVVTTPDPAAITDAYGTIKALAGWSDACAADVATPELVLNQVHGVSEAQQLAARLQDVCRRFLARAPALAAWFPKSALIARSARAQTPFALREGTSLEAHCLSGLAARIQFRFRSGRTSHDSGPWTSRSCAS